jgi:hypothetical protein
MPRSPKTPTLDRGCLSVSCHGQTVPSTQRPILTVHLTNPFRHPVSPRTQKQCTSPSRARAPGHQGATDDDLVSPVLSAFSQPLQGHLTTSDKSNHCLPDSVFLHIFKPNFATIYERHGYGHTRLLSRPSRDFDVHPLLPPSDIVTAFAEL